VEGKVKKANARCRRREESEGEAANSVYASKIAAQEGAKDH